MKAKVIILKNKFKGEAKLNDFELIEEELPPLNNGEFLAEAEWISVDPYMRIYTGKIGEAMIAEQVAKIIESKNDKFPIGQYVIGEFGWRTHTIASEKTKKFSPLGPRLLPEFGDLSRSLALGMLGMTGCTAYFCLLKNCKPVKGDTLVISGAGGAVGSHAGQIGKILGCRVIGITDTDEKGEWLVNELNFDAYVHCHKPDFLLKLAKAAPNGIDCYFDNIGGEITNQVLTKINKNGRLGVCGTISNYNVDDEDIKSNEVEINFSVFRYAKHWNESIEQNMRWIREGKLKYRETITNGFENTSRAFIGMMQGENIGKAVVKV